MRLGISNKSVPWPTLVQDATPQQCCGDIVVLLIVDVPKLDGVDGVNV
jgi:hypothetical protein